MEASLNAIDHAPLMGEYRADRAPEHDALVLPSLPDLSALAELLPYPFQAEILLAEVAGDEGEYLPPEEEGEFVPDEEGASGQMASESGEHDSSSDSNSGKKFELFNRKEAVKKLSSLLGRLQRAPMAASILLYEGGVLTFYPQ